MAANGHAKNPKWLVMLYLSGDNNLSPDMVWAINEIRESRVPEDFAVTIQYDGLTPGNPTVRYAIDEGTHVQSGATLGPIPFPEAEVETLAEDDAGNPDVLAEFVRWSAAKYPSARYRMLILSGHGSGMIGDFLTDENARRQLQPGAMTIRGLADAIGRAHWRGDQPAEQNEAASPPVIPASGGPVLHILGLDSCLMSTLEVASELKGLVQFLVASEGFVPNTGWPYGYLLECLKHRVKEGAPLDPKSVSGYLVTDCATYYRTYLPAGVSFDIASCQIDLIGGVRYAVEKLTAALRPLATQKALQDGAILAHWRAQSFKWEQYVDLWDFCDQLGSQIAELQVPCMGVMRSISGSGPHAVAAHESVGIEFQHAHGLSVYLPWSIPAFETPDWLELYGQLDFPSKSGWLQFLRTYATATMRPPAALVTGEPSVEWPPSVTPCQGNGSYSVSVAESRPKPHIKVSPDQLHSRVSPDQLHSRVSPDQLHSRVSPDQLHSRVSPDQLHRRVSPDQLHSRMSSYQARTSVIGSMKNPPQTVRIPEKWLAARRLPRTAGARGGIPYIRPQGDTRPAVWVTGALAFFALLAAQAVSRGRGRAAR